MLVAGRRKANSPRLSETACSFLSLEAWDSGPGSGITTISALGSAKPFSRKTVPSSRTYGSAAAFFLAAAAGRAKAAARSRRLMPILFFLFFLFILVLILVVFGIFFVVLVLVLLLIL